MQVEIKEIKELESKFGKFKAIELADGTKYNVGIDKPPYKFITAGFTGTANIELAKSKKGTEYIKIFKEVSPSTQNKEKSHHEAPKPLKSDNKYKCDPDKLAQEEWKRRHTSWIGCLQCASSILVKTGKSNDTEVIQLTNNLYDALCERVDKSPLTTTIKKEIDTDWSNEKSEQTEVVGIDGENW